MKCTNSSSLALILLLALTGGVQASRQDDSLHAVLNGARSVHERTDALLLLAERYATEAPGESRMHARNAWDLAVQSGNQAQMHRALEILRLLKLKAEALDDLLRTCIKAMEVSEAMGNARLMAADLQWLSKAYELSGVPDKALEMSRKALFLELASGDLQGVANARLHGLRLLSNIRRYDDVQNQSEPTLAAFAAINDTLGMAHVWTLMADALLARHKHADALPFLYKARQVFAQHDNKEGRLEVLVGILRAQLAMKRTADAELTFKEAMDLAAYLGDRNARVQLLEHAATLAEVQGDLRTALANERACRALRDSLRNARTLSHVTSLQVLYEVGEKDRDLRQLRANMADSESFMEKARLREWWQGLLLVCLAVGLVITSFVVLSRRRSLRNIRRKNHVIREQAEKLHAKNLELERQQMRLRETLISEEEKNVLLKEIHHRVKNNLQIISSLLNMQAMQHQDTAHAQILLEALGRVKAMALVHESIYRCGDLSRIDVAAHMRQLGTHILTVYGAADRVQLEIKADMPPANIDTLIPLSLLVNELITNSAKHAFPNDHQGQVRLVISMGTDGSGQLYYSDDGLADQVPVAGSTNSVGMELIRALAAQMDGEVRHLDGDGTTFVADFRTVGSNLRIAS